MKMFWGRMNKICLRVLVSIHVGGGVVQSSNAGVTFEDVSDKVGISHTGQTWGVSWGDYNSDGWPDVWLSNHQEFPSLYVNQGNGTFIDKASIIVPFADADADTHGAVWGRLYNKNSDSLYETSGSGSSSVKSNCDNPLDNWYSFLFTFQGEVGSEIANDLGVRYPCGRGRTPIWLDSNGDGKLDLFVSNETTSGTFPSILFNWEADSHFHEDAESEMAGKLDRSNYPQIGDLSGDGVPDLIVTGFYEFPGAIFNIPSLKDIKQSISLPATTLAYDSAIGDFNGDLQNDVVIARSKGDGGPDVSLVKDNHIEAMVPAKDPEVGFDFGGGGDLTVDILSEPYIVESTRIFLGATGIHPESSKFTLSRSDPNVQFDGGQIPTGNGFFIGYDATQSKWKFRARNLAVGQPENMLQPFAFLINTTETVVDLAAVGFTAFTPSLTPKYFVNTSGGIFSDKSSSVGLIEKLNCGSVVAADFDNDMNLDIYFVCRSITGNLPNVLYLNDGAGNFVKTADAGSAAGSTEGRGESVASADYDADGFMDLFVTNGKWPPPFYDGPHQLMWNTTNNGNHWLEIDLEGVISNPAGIGARIVAVTGEKAQLREQNGGVHLYSQNHQRIHFGMAGNEVVDNLTITWPSGVVQVVENMPVDQVIQVVEPVYPEMLPGRPNYVSGVNDGVYVWKDTLDGPYKIRLSNSLNFPKTTKVSFLSDKTIVANTEVGASGSYDFVKTGNAIEFSLSGLVNEDTGFDVTPQTGASNMIAIYDESLTERTKIAFGVDGSAMSPSGWVVDLDVIGLAQVPLFATNTYFSISDSGDGTYRAEAVGDGRRHEMSFHVISNGNLTDVTPIGLDSNDIVEIGTHSFSFDGTVKNGKDYVNFSVDRGGTGLNTLLGFSDFQDGLLQARSVRFGGAEVDSPNAYYLPVPNINGKPLYSSSTQTGVWIWEDAGVIKLRVSAGGKPYFLNGTISLDKEMPSLAKVGLEASDVLTQTSATQIDFNFGVGGTGEDGFDFTVPKGTSLTFDLSTNLAGGVVPLVHVGKSMWPVSAVPFSLFVK